MSEYLSLGPTPCDESCYPTNSNPQMERIELTAYRNQLTRVLELEFKDDLCVSVVRKSFPHDEGSYYEICVIYDSDDSEQVRQAFWLESNTPEEWDGVAEEELKAAGYVAYIHKPSYADDPNWIEADEPTSDTQQLEVRFIYCEESRKWIVKVVGTTDKQEAKDAFTAVVLTCHQAEAHLLPACRINDDFEVSVAMSGE